MLVLEDCKSFFWGPVIAMIRQPPTNTNEVLSALGWGALSKLVVLGGKLSTQMVRIGLEEQQMSRELERAIKFNCVPSLQR